MKLRPYLPALWLAAMPYGPTISSIFFVLALMQTISTLNWSYLSAQLNKPWFMVLMMLCIYTLLSLSWSPEYNHDALSNIKKVWRFLLIPILMQGFVTNKQKNTAINGFIIGMLLTVLLSFLKQALHVHWHHDDDAGHIFYNHINTGFFCVFAAFCSINSFFTKSRYKNLYLASFFILSAEVFFINSGRAAYILYMAFLVTFIWLKSTSKLRWLYLGLMLMGLFMLLKFSAVFQTRINDCLQDLDALQYGMQSTSIGYRLQFYQFATMLFKKHLIIGNGPGSFYYYFKLYNPVPDWSGPPNTHSQYLLILVEEGLIGFGLWLLFFHNVWQKIDITGKYLIFLLMINSFSDAILYSAPGQLLLATLALSLTRGKK